MSSATRNSKDIAAYGPLRSFPMGGVHPPENKLTADVAIRTLDPPKSAIIPLAQHLGAPAKPVVEKGAMVKVGTRIGEASSFISANIHSSVSGKVKKIDSFVDVNGYRKEAVFIDVEGDEWEESIDRSEELVTEITVSPEEIVEKIKEAGIVGEGGATFPTNVKYMIPEGKSVDTLIINGVECEPYLTVDHRMMLERPEELLVGTELLRRALKVDRAFIGIEANKPDAIAIVGEACRRYEGIDVVPLKVQYPQGAEKQLIKAILDREVPSGKLPLDVGCVVNNVGTALSVYEAIQKNKPLIDRYITVTGKHMPGRGNFLVRIGTPVSELVEAAGGLPEDSAKVVIGGPMTGKAAVTLDVPATKGTSGIVVFSSEEARRQKVENCIRCTKCVTACPMGLEPYLLEKLVRREAWEEAESNDIMDCIECGGCSFTCPAGRPILDYIRIGKAKVVQLRRSRG
ncbi:MAG: electron transport complex subunit RsxC [Alkalispirochaetaceae bacterium]